MNAKEAAKRMIRPYVLRGDPLQWLVDGQMGSYCGEYSAQIGNSVCPDGALADRTIRCRKLTSRQIAGKPAGGEWEVFSLEALYAEIQREASGEPVQAALL